MATGSAFRRPHQNRLRAIVKTLCYRLLMLLITVAVAWVVVGDAGDALNIGLAANLVKTGTYYGYERLWDRISWGVVVAE
ncbi:DUF2061 domain-containing protein [Halostella sp. JP-L12]|uniref:DUF2061 domain-containing protein n=1 Tax=Halostella TaxID=1843185 RepID=UPI000EF79024|nr:MULTISPECIES: DUF2061 domain-containing protein [Halostella]NHN49101.1 DUF2061 domain-containing protein [Halostella sp. JP-L12]